MSVRSDSTERKDYYIISLFIKNEMTHCLIL